MEIQPFSKGEWNIGRPIVAEQSPWFKGKEVATCLGYGDAPQALRKNVDEEDKMTYEKLTQGVVCETPPSNQQPHEVYINESGLYCLVLRSNKPQAKSFKRWVTSEVLPSIRKHGSYGVAELTEQVKELRTAMTTLTQRLEAQSQIQAVAERLNSIENNVKNIPEYGPRIEQSRGFPVNPAELTGIGLKLEALEDTQRWMEFGLPTSTFLQEKYPGKKVARINSCFAKLLKKRRVELYRKDPESNQIFLIYHQGAWRIAYFEDDRELMEKVLGEPAMKEAIKRLIPNAGNEPNKRQATLDAFVFSPAGTRDSPCRTAPETRGAAEDRIAMELAEDESLLEA